MALAARAWLKAAAMSVRHTIVPLRQFRAIAPSGGQILFIKFSEADRELSPYHGILTADEDAIWWKAKLKAERPGIEKWNKARALLIAAGWTVEDLPCLSWAS